jgi:hypothetical protein
MATLPINPLPTAQPQSPPPPQQRSNGSQPLPTPFAGQPDVWHDPPPPGMANTQPQTSMTTSTARRSTGSQPLGTPFGQPAVPGVDAQTPRPAPTSPQGADGVGMYTPVADEASIVNNYLNQLISADSALMRNARTLGIEHAAARGLQNSSIAAGNAQRAALDAALPLAQQALDMFNQRENRQWTSSENRLDRQQQLTMAEVQNWLNNESFMRDFNAQLALAPVANTFQLLQMIMQQAVEQPDVYTPDVVSGFSEFFNTNMLDILARYFPTLYRANTGGA